MRDSLIAKYSPEVATDKKKVMRVYMKLTANAFETIPRELNISLNKSAKRALGRSSENMLCYLSLYCKRTQKIEFVFLEVQIIRQNTRNNYALFQINFNFDD